ncbi:DUF1963 domain-containing protein [Marinobacter zhejiangensis]|uniref:DUF1963 domain-containing protein n=1 Tax=Marinobacter zhejiangensis TaxID=488535 RepID=A0A1I4PWM8_9GAMM|nr:DUF1963 domain-containing protein [Marinobacter zhejiangensis]SFM32006.1 protein of unknown function [Marinobacter zhejiangensis]
MSSSQWFQILKKIKTDQDFIDQQDTLSQLLQQGVSVDCEDSAGRTALQLLFAKPSPSTLATQWLLQCQADPLRLHDMQLKMLEHYPKDGDSAAQILQKCYQAAPYLAVISATEQLCDTEKPSGTEDGVADGRDYQRKIDQALLSQRRIEALKSCYQNLPTGFRCCFTKQSYPWQSHWRGMVNVPQTHTDDGQDVARVLQQHPQLQLLTQIYFEELSGNHLLPGTGLLQLYLTPQDELQIQQALDDQQMQHQDDYDTWRFFRQPLRAFYWSQLPSAAHGWSPRPQHRLTSYEYRCDGEPVQSAAAIDWQARPQLDNQVDHSEALASLPAELRASRDELSQEFYTGSLGLLPQPDERISELLPTGHQPLLHVLHLSQGGLLISLPAGALAGNNSRWQEVTLTRYYD